MNKYPKSSKYGRQNTISEQWNSEEQLLHWRKQWAYYVNRELEGCELDERIDHRSHKDRGLLEQPTIHEGVIAIAMERKGYISERREINRQIRKDNSFLRNIMDTIKYLFKTIFAIIDRIADEMEEVCVNMLALEYDRFEGYPDEATIQKQMQTYRALEAKAADLDQEKLNEKRMSIRPKKEEEAQSGYPTFTEIAKKVSSISANSTLSSALESSLRMSRSKNPTNSPFLHRVGSEVGRREMIATSDKGKGGKSEDFPP